jgi:hypothetical protein
MRKPLFIQKICLGCLREHARGALVAVSSGKDGCVWCGAMSRPMTESEYQAELAEKKLLKLAAT